MTAETRSGPGFWRTLLLLLRLARRRAVGRLLYNQRLRYQRAGKPVPDWGIIPIVIIVLFLAVANWSAANLILGGVVAAQRIEAADRGAMVAHDRFVAQVRAAEQILSRDPTKRAQLEQQIRGACGHEHKLFTREFGQSAFSDWYDRCLEFVMAWSDRVVDIANITPGLRGVATSGALPTMVVSLVTILWLLMLICQNGELEIDTQRRRHPMWEWLFSHPVPPGAVFLAEMLSPIAGNPALLTAPLFWGTLYGAIYGPELGVIAAVAVGIPIMVGAACVGKALEIAIMLRVTPRNRGAAITLIGWLGFVLLLLLVVGGILPTQIVTTILPFIKPLAAIPWPPLGLLLGARRDGSFSFLIGLAACWAVAVPLIVSAVWFCIWGARRGLAGNYGRDKLAPGAMTKRRTVFGKNPLYRKELLWFRRDRGAIVQTVLLPLTVAGAQAFNFHNMVAIVQDRWSAICGGAILLGTYMLFYIGPRSLVSEGAALWIALTWPRGLEELLKAKARLWWLIASAVVAPIMLYAAIAYPASAWKVALVGIGWVIFGRSMAEKMVTLATLTSESGEVQRVPAGRRWATTLGTLTFAIGVLSQQWPVMIAGIVFSILTAAAMWQNFRARLPYLYDPWSERLPQAPTVMHAMIAISALVDLAVVLTGLVVAYNGMHDIFAEAYHTPGFVPGTNLVVTQTITYGLSAAVVSLVMVNFLGERGVSISDIFHWHPDQFWPRGEPVTEIMLGIAGGIVLGALGLAYLALLPHLPFAESYIKEALAQASKAHDFRPWLLVLGVVFAPLTEEFLFRGLLYRTLDRLWGGWRALIGSAAFFAIYHPFLSWPPVLLLAIVNALLFKKTGRLAPAVGLHAVYNAMVIGLG